MASYHFQITSLGRGAGRRATAAAAYRAGERLRDERSGRIYNYSKRKDVLHTEIFLPAHLKGAADHWAGSRERLWNGAEHAEKRANSRVAREYQVALPHELNSTQQIELARALSRELAERYKVAVDLAVHGPRPDGDPRNFHAHVLTTTREVTPAGLSAKAGLDLDLRERRRRELPDVRTEFITLRERWATLTNEALREANIEARVDHRSFAARGIDRVPRPTIPIASLKMEHRGVRSTVAERLREDYRQRVQRHLEQTAAARAANDGQRTNSPPSAPERVATPGAAAIHDVDEIRRQAREAWLRSRSREAEPAVEHGRDHVGDREHTSPEPEPVSMTRGVEDDLAL
jgi:ATP-dependent exoDNAse (exonuclease V) alpha subunit